MAPTYTVEIDSEGCKGCGYCHLACPAGVFSLGEKTNRRGYRAYQVAQPEKCRGCRKCFLVCPDFCLEVKVAQREGRAG
ncbi:MAG: 4Fe-4S dicluster domain-containing protein [Planctomycetota bacterium]|jgi:2-oxoglutarate ferredoxin oxidoreductase subunit delta|nr:4Fe-4S dicluster domain-containing protein [Planctomycetota bacterium]